MLRFNTAEKVLVSLVDGAGAKTGLVPADFRNGQVQIVRGDGSKVLVTLATPGNWSEVDAVLSPGLYQLSLDASVTSVAGPLSISFQPSAAAFLAKIILDEVAAPEASVWGAQRASFQAVGTFGEGFRHMYQSLVGHCKIANNTLTVYAEDGTTPLKAFPLKDIAGFPTNLYATERG